MTSETEIKIDELAAKSAERAAATEPDAAAAVKAHEQYRLLVDYNRRQAASEAGHKGAFQFVGYDDEGLAIYRLDRAAAGAP